MGKPRATAAAANLAVVLVLSGLADSPALAAKSRKNSKEVSRAAGPQFGAGRTLSVKIPGTQIIDKKHKEFLVYVPSNYSPEQEWPAIFWLHGVNWYPTIANVQMMTGGRDYILVGVAYYLRGEKGFGYYHKDLANLKVAIEFLGEHLKLDKELLFVGGFSEGAFCAHRMMCLAPELWDGALLFGAGANEMAAIGRKASAIRGKNVLLCCGTEDHRLPYVETGYAYYKGFGANATFVKVPGVDHRCVTDSKEVREWLQAHGLGAQIDRAMALAAKHKKAGRHGQAYVLYVQAAAIDSDCPAREKAAQEAAAIAEKAQQALDKAEKASLADSNRLAKRLLGAAAKRYRDSKFGDEARRRLDELKSRAAADREADAESAGKRRKAGKGDKSERRCRGWWSMAQNYVRIGKVDQARKYLKKIVEGYPNSEWAKKAEKEVERLSAGE